VKRLYLPALALGVLLLSQAVHLRGQSDAAAAALRGTITDSSGRAVAAVVTVTDTGRGVNRVAHSSDTGSYQIQSLAPGTYELRASADGFETAVANGIQLSVGETGVYDVELHPGAVFTQVHVTAQAPLVDVARSDQAETIRTSQVENLPNLDRNFFYYVYTLPGVSNANAVRAQGNNAFTFSTSGFSVGGSNGRFNLITVDGGENEFGDGEPRYYLSPESIQEFQVNRNGFAAEFGFTAGTAVNVITRSGSNAPHGSVFAFYRSEHTSARNFFDTLPRKAFDQRVAPGVTLGGALVKNKLFAFTSYEYTKADTARFRDYTSANVLQPSDAQAAYIATLRQAPDSNIRRIAGELAPALNTTSFPATMALLQKNQGQFTSVIRQQVWSTRLDWNPRDQDRFTLRFAPYHDHYDFLDNNNLIAPSNTSNVFNRDFTTVMSWTRTVSPHAVNTARIQIAPWGDAHTVNFDLAGTQVDIQGVGSFGHNFTSPFDTAQNRFQFEDSISYVAGKHLLKAGVSARPVSFHVTERAWFNGEWTFSSSVYPVILALPPADQGALAAYNAANGISASGPPAASLTALETYNLGLPFLFRQASGNPSWRGWQTFLGAFVQDSWTPVRNLTIDAGLRFDDDREAKPIAALFRVSPRLGFAWDPFGDQKTVIRASGGLFQAPVPYQIDYLGNLLDDSGRYINQVFETPLSGAHSPPVLWGYGIQKGLLPQTALTLQDLQTLGVSPAPQAPGRVIFGISTHFQAPYTVQGSFGITRRLTEGLALDVAYQVYRGIHLPVSHEVNYRETGASAGPGLGPALVPIDPSIVENNMWESIGNSIYHGMTVSVRKRTGPVSLNVNYTFSKSIDDVTDFSSGFAAYLPSDLRLERALSTFDIRHNLAASAVLESPLHGGAGAPWVSRALAGVSLSPVVSVRSGIPFTVLIGTDVNGDTHTNDRPFGAARNTGTGDPFYGVDLRLRKRLPIGEKVHAELIAEATNILNHTNFLAVNNTVGLDPRYLFGPYHLHGNRQLAPTAPLGYIAAADPRRIQFGLRFAF
jgi:Carboxypeptidase regulatory-like domain